MFFEPVTFTPFPKPSGNEMNVFTLYLEHLIPFGDISTRCPIFCSPRSSETQICSVKVISAFLHQREM